MNALRDIGNRSWLFWIGLVIGLGGFCWGATRNPAALAALWAGDSWTWLAVLAVAATAAAAVQRRLRRSQSFGLVLGCGVVVAAFGFNSLITVALILVAGFALGARLLEFVQRDPREPLAIDVFSTTIVGLSAASLLLAFVAHWPVNIPIVYVSFSVAVIGLGWRHLQQAWRAFAESGRTDRSDATPVLLLAALWLAFGLHVAFAALPERYADALAMHLVIARALELFGYWHFDAREYVWAVQPMAANWLFGWAYVLSGEAAAKLLNAVLLLLIGGVLVESRLLSRCQGLIAAAIVALTPLTLLVSASLFVDNALAMFTVVAFIFAARLRDSPSPAFIAAFAIASAGALSVKLHGVLALASVCLALLVFGGWRELYRTNGRTKIVCLVALAAGFWPYAYAWFATGNPVFPHFNGIFKSAYFAPRNFEMAVYPAGVSLADFFDLTFSSSKYLEGNDGAFGFVIPLLFPAALLLIVAKGSSQWRFIMLASIVNAVLVLLNIRYIRYLFPVLPLFALALVYPLSVVKGPSARAAVLIAVIVGIGWGVLRIPAGGWILKKLDPPTAFSARAKQELADFQVPPRHLGRIQAAIGNRDSRVVVFGQAVGADIAGRPLYTNWYHPKLQDLVLNTTTSSSDAAVALALLNTTHVIFDNRNLQPVWKPWHEAAEKYGRLVAGLATGELYEFHVGAVPGNNVFGDASGGWQKWEMHPNDDKAIDGIARILPPSAALARAADIGRLPPGTRVTLTTNHTCEAKSLIRAQINWLRIDGSIIRTDITRSACESAEGVATVSATKPEDARTAYFYFTNDGYATARLYGERATVLANR